MFTNWLNNLLKERHYIKGQQGRTMLEGLAVLAIIGILSVVGITGYSLAMNKHKANTLITESHRRAIIASSQLFLDRPASLAEFTDNDFFGCSFDTNVTTGDLSGQFGIKIKHVDKDICQHMLKMIGGDTAIRRLSSEADPQTPLESCIDNDSLLLIYDVGHVSVFPSEAGDSSNTSNTSPSEQSSAPPPVTCYSDTVVINNCDGSTTECCPDDGPCVQPTGCCIVDSACPGSNNICVNNQCTCPDGWFRNTNKNCTICSNTAGKETSAEECAKCKAAGFPRKMDKYGKCVLEGGCPNGTFAGIGENGDHMCLSCSDPSRQSVSEEECNKCGDARKMIGGKCSPTSCPDGKFLNTNGECISCSNKTSHIPYTPSECAKCSNRKMDNEYCVATCDSGEFQESSGNCVKCSTAGKKEASAEECGKCSDTTPRITWQDSSTSKTYCALCPEGQFYEVLSTGIYCQKCSNSKRFKSSAEECAKCSTTDNPRQMIGEWCTPPCSSGYFRKENGDCDACSDIYRQVPYDETECGKCSDTESPRQMVGEYCDLICPQGWFKNANGNCTDCSNTAGKKTSAQECQKCSDTANPRHMVGEWCMPKVCPDGQFYEITSSGGTCRYCSSPNKSFKSTAEECARCDTTGNPREMAGDTCMPACGDGSFRLENGDCTSCTDLYRQVPYSEAECAKCAGSRRMTNGYCDWICPDGWFRNTNGNCTICSNELGREASEEECRKCNDSGYPRYIDENGICRRK